jgi:benzoyl-CoA reductase/2-hydroxyglutaryl-CoA dehydratase subunit BcrC/BadD/HgdB
MNTHNNQAEKQRQRFLRQVARRAAGELRDIRGDQRTPEGLEYFLDVLERVFVDNQLPRSLQDHERTLVGSYCVMAPEELIYAAGAAPIRLCGGSFEAAQLGEDFVPRDGCPVVKSSLGFAMQNGFEVFDQCRTLVMPTTCDGKRKLGEELSHYKEVWMLEVPHIKDAEYGRRLWQEQVYGLKKKLEKLGANHGGKGKITTDSLRKAMNTIARAQFEARRLLALRQSPEPVIKGLSAILVMNAYAYDHAASWAHELSQLNDELEDKRAGHQAVCPGQSPRVMLAGSPVIFPTLKIPALIEQMGGVLVCDESCMGDRYIYDPVGHSEKTLRGQMTSIASRYLMPCTCPSFAPNEERLTRLAQMADDYQVDGVIHHVLKGCIIYDFEIHRVERIMKEKGIPLLRVETDYNPEDVEQLRTRIEAFTEMLREKKQQSKKEHVF